MDANLNGTLAMVSSPGSPKVLFGAKASGAAFDVQDARMSRVHGCTRATFSCLFFGRAKKRYSPAGETNIKHL